MHLLAGEKIAKKNMRERELMGRTTEKLILGKSTALWIESVIFWPNRKPAEARRVFNTNTSFSKTGLNERRTGPN